jgi:hypothetical protein
VLRHRETGQEAKSALTMKEEMLEILMWARINKEKRQRD